MKRLKPLLVTAEQPLLALRAFVLDIDDEETSKHLADHFSSVNRNKIRTCSAGPVPGSDSLH